MRLRLSLLIAALLAGCDGLYSYLPDAGDAGVAGDLLGDGGGIGGGAGGGPSDAGSSSVPITAVAFDWYLRGAPGADEYAIGAAATSQSIVWVRYVSGIGGRIAVLDRASGVLQNTYVTDLSPYNVVSYDETVAILGHGVESVSDWRVHWLNHAGVPTVRSDSMNVVVAGGGVLAGAMYPEPDAGLRVHVIAPRDASGTHVSALTRPDGGVQRTENTCGNTMWWDSATAPGSNRRFFIGAVAASCNLGNGSYVSPSAGQLQWVLARYSGINVPGVPIVRELGGASKSIPGPAALGTNADSVWVAYYAPTGHLRLEHFSTDSVASLGQWQASGQAYVTGQASRGMAVADVLPHPNLAIDRVYLAVTIYDSKSTWRDETLPVLNQSTIALYTFTRLGKLVGVTWVPTSNAPKSASSMAFIDDRLVISGQCDSTPAGGTSDPLCNPLATALSSSFVFSIPAP